MYCALVVLAAANFARGREQSRQGQAVGQVPVSLLKPLHGDEPDLEERIEAFFEQDYPDYEILFCARDSEDRGLRVAARAAARHPDIPVQLLTVGEPPYANAKVASLERMALVARHDLFVVSDSDVQVASSYLRDVVAPFANRSIGLVTCLYRGVGAGKSLWSRLEATAMSIEMTAGVLVAKQVEGMRFALGPTMAVRRQCVDEIGGFGALAHYCADDFVLGNQIAARGHDVVLSHHVIDHIVLHTGFLESMKHQARWMKSTRYSRPKGHVGTALTFSVPYGLLACATAVSHGRPLIGLAALVWAVLCRVLMAAVVGRQVVDERHLWRTLLLYPVRDLMGFGFWLASYASNKILWRGETYELLRGGVMRRYAPAEGPVRTMGGETLIPPRP